MSHPDFNQRLIDAMVKFEEAQVMDLVSTGLKEGVKPPNLIDILSEGLRLIGKRFEAGEAFIPELILGGNIFGKAVERIQPHLEAGYKREAKGKVLIGTVYGDLHDLGKSLVILSLKMAGYEVIDLGRNIPTEDFVRRAKEEEPQVLGMSALLTTTMEKQREVINGLKKAGIRQNLKVIIGGAPVNQDWANEIGADAYGADAIDALAKVEVLLR